MENSRRDFLRLSAVGLASTAAKRIPTSLHLFAPQPFKPIAVWVTNQTRRFSSSPAISWRPVATINPDQYTITLNPDTKFQEILGFGAAFTDAACYTFNRLTPQAREQLFHQLFDPAQMSFNVGRTCIGASDYSRSAYSFDDGDADPELKRFSISHDEEYILPMLRAAIKANPNLFLLSSPWSPPGWMKDKNTLLGGVMQTKYLKTYANYFVRFLQAYANAGVRVQAVTVQNEVDTDQDGAMPACAWPQQTEMAFVSQDLGPTFARNNFNTKIWLLDHNYDLWGRAMDELGNADVHKYANAIAWHGYSGSPEMIDKVQAQYPEVEMHWTEGGPAITDANYSVDWVYWSTAFTGILRHWCRSITAWNFALDEKGNPNIGQFRCGGLMTIDSNTMAVSYSGQYHAFAHFSRTIRRGAHRFDSQSANEEVLHVGFENPDGGWTLVLTNPGNSKTVIVKMGGLAAEVALDANSITTLEWQ
jgi:glucosylceramidase